MDVADASAIVTGGASGLGLATVEYLAGRGAQVVITDLASSAGADIAQRTGSVFVAADITDPDAMRSAVGAAVERGPLRVLVNCAGIGPPARVIGRNGVLPLEQFERVVRINLIGTFNATRLAAEAMAGNDPVDGDRGVIVMTASVAAFDGQIGQASYSASKGGIVGMLLPVARDLANTYGLLAQICPATPSALGRRASGSTTELTSPMSPASAAATNRPVSSSSNDRDAPTILGSSQLTPMSQPDRPTRTNAALKRAERSHSRMSLASASASPPPAAAP